MQTLQNGRSLQTKIMLFVGFLFLTTFFTCSLLYIHNFRKNYLEAIEWRSVTLAQSLRGLLEDRYEKFGRLADLDLIRESTYLECKKLYDVNHDMHVSFVCIVNKEGVIITHNDKKMWKQSFTSKEFDSALQTNVVQTVQFNETYHTLIPVITQEGVFLGIIDVGFPQHIVDQKLMTGIGQALALFILLFASGFIATWTFVRRSVTNPVTTIIQSTKSIEQGHLTREITVPSTKEFKELALSLARMRDAIHESMANLEAKNQETSALIACSPVALFSLHMNGTVAIWTASALRLFGWQPEEVNHKPLPTVLPEDQDQFSKLLHKASHGTLVLGVELRQICRDGSLLHGLMSLAPIWSAEQTITGIMATVEDTTEKIKNEKAHLKMQEQLLQAQKMESIGRLAGGVAHDYNNTLSVILGYAELIKEDLAPDDAHAGQLEQIIKATMSSADITRQLLAFARKQAIDPKPLDMNKQIENLLKMLRRLIGENIELTWQPEENLGTVKLDAMQVDQILANLCVNARDAIKGTGQIKITTHSFNVDEKYCEHHSEFIPGEYVCLRVSDSGTGMDTAMMEKMFEPFFTTKRKGEGTGLGLSTVYGIVKQNKGIITVESELGKGTTFSLFFPVHGDQVLPQASENAPIPQGNHEMVLLVEDDAAILEMTRSMLQSLGYRVTSTANPEEGIEFARNMGTELNLLITDVIMPVMDGWEMSSRIRSFCPELKIIYISGYTADFLSHQGGDVQVLNFMQKPFTKNELAKKIRSVLES
nr:ATP-binding protein [uncultured Desulfobulbus sp.]